MAEEGIEYLHIRSLGSPRESRKKLRENGDFESFSREYADHLECNTEDVESLLNLILSGKRAALMCFEKDHMRCHRTLLAQELLDGSVEDLRFSTCKRRGIIYVWCNGKPSKYCQSSRRTRR